MNKSMLAISFDYESHQGRFKVSYNERGFASVNAYCMPDDADPADISQSAIGVFGQIDNWEHTEPVADDIRKMDEVSLKAKYRALFLDRDIERTGLETEEEGAIPRIEVTVALRGEHEVGVVFRADGGGYMNCTTGWITFRNNRQVEYTGPCPTCPFGHDVPAEKIIADLAVIEREGDSEQAYELKCTYVDLFWDTINLGLEEPWLQSEEELEDGELTLKHGTLAELKALLADAARLDDKAWRDGNDTLTLCGMSATDGDNIRVPLHYDDNNSFSDSIRELATQILKWAHPEGYKVEYNDGSRLSWSGYSKRSQEISVEVTAPSATERMEALERLMTWSAANGVEIDKHLPN